MYVNTNINSSIGIYNGRKGTVKCIKYAKDKLPESLPEFVVIEVDDCKLKPEDCFNGEKNLIAI